MAAVPREGKRILVTMLEGMDLEKSWTEHRLLGDNVLTTGKLVNTIKDEQLAALSPDGKYAVLQERKGLGLGPHRLREVDGFKLVTEFYFQRGLLGGAFVPLMAITPNNKTLVVPWKKAIHLFDLPAKPAKATRILDVGDTDVKSLCIAPAGGRLAAATSDGKVHVFNLQTGALLSRFQPGADTFGVLEPGVNRSLDFNVDGSRLAVAAVVKAAKTIVESETDVMIFDPETGKMLQKLERVKGTFPLAPVFSPSGHRLAALCYQSREGSSWQRVVVWDVPK